MLIPTPNTSSNHTLTQLSTLTLALTTPLNTPNRQAFAPMCDAVLKMMPTVIKHCWRRVKALRGRGGGSAGRAGGGGGGAAAGAGNGPGAAGGGGGVAGAAETEAVAAAEAEAAADGASPVAAEAEAIFSNLLRYMEMLR